MIYINKNCLRLKKACFLLFCWKAAKFWYVLLKVTHAKYFFERLSSILSLDATTRDIKPTGAQQNFFTSMSKICQGGRDNLRDKLFDKFNISFSLHKPG